MTDKYPYKPLSCLKSLLFLLSLLILMASPALAKELYSDWHYSGESFIVDGEVIELTHYDFYDTKVILSANERTYILNKGECKSSELRDYCITDIFQDLDSNSTKDPIKYLDGKIYAGIEVTIRERGPVITIKRAFSNNSLLLGQDVTITVTITNNGTEGTDSFTYQETMPGGVIIASASSSASYKPNQVVFSANFPALSQKTFSYTLRLLEHNDFSSFAIANYTYAGKDYGLKTSTTKVTVKKPYDLAITLSPAKLPLFEQASYTVKITNKHTQAISIGQLSIKIPPGITVVSASGDLKKNGNAYSWNGSLGTGLYQSFILKLKPTNSGKYNLETNLSLTAGDEGRFSENKTTTLTVEVKALAINLDLTKASLSEGAQFSIFLAAENPNDNIFFKNIKAWINSSFFQKDISLVDSLAPKKAVTLYFDQNMIAPLVGSSQRLDITAYGTYETTSGEVFNFSKKQSLQVTPISKAIAIFQKASKAQVVAGHNLTVNISIKNNNQEPVQVEVSDTYSEGVTIMGGKTSETLPFTKAETKQAYAYILYIPEHYDKEELIITTTATIIGKNYSDTSTLNISVNITKPAVVDEDGEDDGTEAPELPSEGQVKKEEKPGFFKRIIDAIRNFFKKMV